MTIVYLMSFIDRQILSNLAEQIRGDLDLTDAELGFLYGTVFAIFYTLFGIPLGRLVDSWRRERLMAIGLALWSTMTMLSGFASSFALLAIARVGVGIGEASAAPAAFSMLGDYFPKRQRALANSIVSSGLFIGMGLSLPLGGAISTGWNAAFPASPPLGLVGWQVAFIAVGFPGLLVAAWVWSLREPQRHDARGKPISISYTGVWRRFTAELFSILPPFTLWSVARFPGRCSQRAHADRGGGGDDADGRSHRRRGAVDGVWDRPVCHHLLGPDAAFHRPPDVPAHLGHAGGFAGDRGIWRARRRHVLRDLLDRPLCHAGLPPRCTNCRSGDRHSRRSRRRRGRDPRWASLGRVEEPGRPRSRLHLHDRRRDAGAFRRCAISRTGLHHVRAHQPSRLWIGEHVGRIRGGHLSGFRPAAHVRNRGRRVSHRQHHDWSGARAVRHGQGRHPHR
ncbi:MAG: MFS transporter [Proteobacteria bacterium]|nr:MFS transporter [Pseudomonadota bacterium]